MNGVSKAVTRWLAMKRETDRAWAAVVSVTAFGGGAVVFLLTTLLFYIVLWVLFASFIHARPLLAVVALGLTTWLFARFLKSKYDAQHVRLDPDGFWVFKDLCSFGPHLILEGLRQVRRCGDLSRLNVPVCARALAYLAGQNAAVSSADLIQHCPLLPWERLRQQLLLLDGVLFLGHDRLRVTLLEPFRLRLRWMLNRDRSWRGNEPARPTPKPPPETAPVNEPEKLTAYEILGLSPSATAAEIKTAYRIRVKACHPDLFAGMDDQARALAERWTKALNAAYATLNSRTGAKSDSAPDR